MGGLAIGSYLVARLGHISTPLKMYGILEILIGLYALLLPYLFGNESVLVPLLSWLYGETGGGAVSAARFIISIFLLLAPTILMGATYPVISSFYSPQNDTVGSRAGLLYSTNSLGAVTGGLLAGFYLLPQLGLSSSNLVAVSINILVGIASLLISSRFRQDKRPTAKKIK
jgi:spermidine synthase